MGVKEFADNVIKLIDEYVEKVMACKCVNEDGTPSSLCMGCYMGAIMNPENQVRAMEDSFTPHQLQQIKYIVSDALSGSVTLEKVWIDGFLKGFEQGQING